MRTIKNIIFPRKSALLKKRSFMMIEIIIDFSVITLIALAVLFAQMVSMKFINNAKARAAAIELANEQMENIRNIAYGDVGMADNTDSSIPTGSIEKESLLSRNGVNFKLVISITYVDDPYDGCSTDPASENCRSQPIETGSSKIDFTKYDYKKVDISVLKPDGTFILAKISSNFSNKYSIIAAGTGVIHVCVNDKNGARVPGVTVTLENDSIPGFSKRLAKLSDNINDSACVSFDMLTPVENHSYHVAVNKKNDPDIVYLSNFSSDQTSPPSAANPFPRHSDLNVNTKQPTSLTLVI